MDKQLITRICVHARYLAEYYQKLGCIFLIATLNTQRDSNNHVETAKIDTLVLQSKYTLGFPLVFLFFLFSLSCSVSTPTHQTFFFFLKIPYRKNTQETVE